MKSRLTTDDTEEGSVMSNRADPTRPKARKTHPFTWFVLALILLIGALFVAGYLPGLIASRHAAIESRAAGVLRKIGQCATEHHSKHGSYPSSLAAMGPAADGCLDAAIAAGERGEYRFSYTPGPADASGRISTYRAEARPVNYRLMRSFLVDESGVLRSTEEDRPAKADDPEVQ